MENAFYCNDVGEKKIKLSGITSHVALSPDESRLISAEYSFNLCVPPEQFDGTGRKRASDIWSLAVMAFYMCNREYPFGGLTQAVIKRLGRKEAKEKMKDKLIRDLDNYKKDGVLPQINNKYARIAPFIQKCLIHSLDSRPEPNDLIKDELFKDLKSIINGIK